MGGSGGAPALAVELVGVLQVVLYADAKCSESLSVLRKNKAEKAEKRKIVKADANQTYDSVHDVSEHSALSEQAEVSEQTMKPDYTGDISNY